MKKTDGFTLVELMVGILATALVSGAIMTFLLMGLNTSRATINANADQQNAKIVISMLEQLASEGNISKLEINGDVEIDDNGIPIDVGDRSWRLLNESGDELLSYSPTEKALYSRGIPLMDGVTASTMTLSKNLPLGGCLLGFALQTKEGFYETSVYNRISQIGTTGIVLDENNFAIIDSNPDISEEKTHTLTVTGQESRTRFLEILLSQYGSPGMIVKNGSSTNVPYSLWYCNGAYPESDPNWNVNTPWCAIFISWAAEQVKDCLSAVPKKANVDELWDTVSKKQTIGSPTPYYDILPGDLIFFDWQRTNFTSPGSLDHVGIVLFVDKDYGLVYTIEGNSGNQVAIRRYTTSNPNIVGYGILSWKASS